jgi:hypothetical protein
LRETTEGSRKARKDSPSAQSQQAAFENENLELKTIILIPSLTLGATGVNN